LALAWVLELHILINDRTAHLNSLAAAPLSVPAIGLPAADRRTRPKSGRRGPTSIVLAIRVSLGVTISLILSTAASAAIKCVNPRNNACFTTIGAAVSAATEGDTIQVANGTYHEIVVIDKSYLSLISTNRKNTIIDASGLGVVVDTNNIASGIYVDGIDNPGLCHAVISGFTIRGANFEGILVANAMAVTVADNFITDNDKSRLKRRPLARASHLSRPTKASTAAGGSI
jgi:hypothetical protein